MGVINLCRSEIYTWNVEDTEQPKTLAFTAVVLTVASLHVHQHEAGVVQ